MNLSEEEVTLQKEVLSDQTKRRGKFSMIFGISEFRVVCWPQVWRTKRRTLNPLVHEQEGQRKPLKKQKRRKSSKLLTSFPM